MSVFCGGTPPPPPPHPTRLRLSPCRSLSSRTCCQSCLSTCPLVADSVGESGLLLRPLCFSSSLGWSCMLDPCRRNRGLTESPHWFRAWVLVSSASCCHGNWNAVSNFQIKTRHACRHQQLDRFKCFIVPARTENRPS